MANWNLDKLVLTAMMFIVLTSCTDARPLTKAISKECESGRLSTTVEEDTALSKSDWKEVAQQIRQRGEANFLREKERMTRFIYYFDDLMSTGKLPGANWIPKSDGNRIRSEQGDHQDVAGQNGEVVFFPSSGDDLRVVANGGGGMTLERACLNRILAGVDHRNGRSWYYFCDKNEQFSLISVYEQQPNCTWAKIH